MQQTLKLKAIRAEEQQNVYFYRGFYTIVRCVTYGILRTLIFYEPIMIFS